MSDLCLTPANTLLGIVAPDAVEASCAAVQNGLANTTGTPFAAYMTVFAINAALEAPAYAVAGYFAGQRARTVLIQIVVLNLATHPAVYYLFPFLVARAGWTALTLAGISEAFALIVEAALLKVFWRYSWLAAAFASLAANLTSWWVGTYLAEAGLLG